MYIYIYMYKYILYIAFTFGSVFATESMAAAYTHGGPWIHAAKVSY